MGGSSPAQTPPYDGPWELARPEDRDPSPGILEINLEARPAEIEYLPGKRTTVWTYNGTVPGPLLEARVGDQLIVHFKNHLPEPTTIHWHGLRLPAEMDGSPATQKPIPPEGSFEYRFPLLDAGLFWFHPHVRGDAQVEKGLYGVILVRGADEPALGEERVLVLDDVLLDEAGKLVEASPPNPAMSHAEGDKGKGPAAPAPEGKAAAMTGMDHSGMPGMSEEAMRRMSGREGNLVLVNGKPRPLVTLKAGERQRWRLVNTANARYFRLSLPGYSLHLVGVDGGLLEAPRPIEELLLARGERAVVVVTATAASKDAALVSLPYERGHGTGGGGPIELLRVRYLGGEATAPPLPETLRTISPLPSPVRTRTLRLSEAEGPDGPIFLINGEAYPKITPLKARLGETEDWEIINESEMDHPFHLHGFFFQVLERGGAAEPYRAWKDTVNIPAKQALRLRVSFQEHAGGWMYHCHILEHGEWGMMGELEVSP